MKRFISICMVCGLIFNVACTFMPSRHMQDAVLTTAVRPEVVLFKADRSNIENGAKTTLRWLVKDADAVTIDNGVGTVPAEGSIEIKPSGLSTYNLTAVNRGGTTVSSVIVNVRPFVRIATASPATTQSPSSPQVSGVLPRLGPNESYVFYGDAVMVGADDHYIVLRNNPQAHNPTWEELKTFLKEDQTDKHPYIQGKYTCGDFAETLHNNAEAAGIRAGLVAIQLRQPGPEGVIVNHSLNMFETTDRGIVYIDDTSSSQGYYADKIVDLQVGKDYVAESIFPQSVQLQKWPSMGKVIAFDIRQW